MNRYNFAALLLVCLGAVASHAASVAKPTCGGTTSSKNIQLLTPSIPPRECNYYISATSSYVCQLRIDFAMTLAQPSIPTTLNGLTYATCVDDYFEVNGMRFCGTETSQHVYMPFNRTAGIKQVDLKIVLASRVGYTGLPTPSWDITVTQLECPTGASIRGGPAFAAADMTPEARSATAYDGFYVAPPGCLQYFPHTTGAITSFNYNNGLGIYPGNMNYAICFRRNSETQALQLHSTFFKLGVEYANLDTDNYCYSTTRSGEQNEDYLLIPQATVEQDNVRATYFCGTSLQDDTILTTNPGPLALIFNSDAIYKAEKELGFALTYSVLSS